MVSTRSCDDPYNLVSTGGNIYYVNNTHVPLFLMYIQIPASNAGNCSVVCISGGVVASVCDDPLMDIG